MAGMKYNKWQVILNGKHIDTVFYTDYCDKDYVLRACIDHDGMNPNIAIKLVP
jgi:hypothetical protein